MITDILKRSLRKEVGPVGSTSAGILISLPRSNSITDPTAETRSRLSLTIQSNKQIVQIHCLPHDTEPRLSTLCNARPRTRTRTSLPLMEFPLVFRTPHPPPTSSFSSSASSSAGVGFCVLPPWKTRTKSKRCFGGFVRASAERSGEGRDGERGGGFTSPAMEVTTLNRNFNDAEFPVWEKIGAVVRLSYGIGIELFISD